jgi:hypothetical protein
MGRTCLNQRLGLVCLGGFLLCVICGCSSPSQDSEEMLVAGNDIVWGQAVSGVRLGASPRMLLLSPAQREIRFTIAFLNESSQAQRVPFYEGSDLDGLVLGVEKNGHFSIVQPSLMGRYAGIQKGPTWKELGPGKALKFAVNLPLGRQLPNLATNESFAFRLFHSPKGIPIDKVFRDPTTLSCGPLVAVRADSNGRQAGVLLVEVTAEGTYGLDGHAVTLEELRTRLQVAAKSATPDPRSAPANLKVFICAPAKTPFKYVREIVRICTALKLWDVTVGLVDPRGLGQHHVMGTHCPQENESADAPQTGE